jgi:UDP-N-acetylmuramoyl-L-alanyl-D-glutamate--2,6-diaminopimelate ligase
MTGSAAADARDGEPVAALIDALAKAGLLVEVHGAVPERIGDLCDDSRRVRPGAGFVAVRGAERDGHDWLEAAEQGGAALAIVEDRARTRLPAIVVRDGRRAAAVAGAAFHGWPSRALTVVGVTGTNGKTTTVGILRHLLDEASAPSASIGTLGVLVGSRGEALPGGGGLTTPGPMELPRVLRALCDRGVRRVAMEVSSHALDQRRVEGVRFAAAVFTNLTRDHLDYHGTLEAYRAAKLRLVALLDRDGVALYNADDEAWRTAPSVPRTWRFGIDHPADVMARDVTFAPDGTRFLLVTPSGAVPVTLPLVGDFNVQNALGAAAAACALGMPLADVAARLATVPQVPGRLERLRTHPTVLRDYAHTPDALDRALRALRPFTRTPDGRPARLIVVFGCGGDRDPGKRPQMGRIAEGLADQVVLTSDNPRTEDPERILDDIEAGMTRRDHLRIEDRRAAIAQALAIAGPDDVVVLAGKGHETSQVRGTTAYPFDERAIVQELAGGAGLAP